MSTEENKQTTETADSRPASCSPLETSGVRWEYEDALPEMEDGDFDGIFKASRVDGVRVYPFVEDSKGNRIWITHLSSDANNYYQGEST
jgi:hypothetical protein